MRRLTLMLMAIALAAFVLGPPTVNTSPPQKKPQPTIAKMLEATPVQLATTDLVNYDPKLDATTPAATMIAMTTAVQTQTAISGKTDGAHRARSSPIMVANQAMK